MKKILILFFLPLFIYAGTHHDWSYNKSIYEVNVRQYTDSGSFWEFEEHLDRLHEMGVGILWFMPIHPIGIKNRLGSLGSYYSVRDYLDVNAEFGDMEEFKHLVNEAHNRGMYVIIDWVANHTSWDNALTTEHPEWYVTQNGSFIAPPGTNWSDVIELDYSQQGLRDYMVDAMKYWIDEAGIDGFRFDAVEMVPDDFWQDALSQLKDYKSDIFFLAEGDSKQCETNGFDMTYCWGLHAFGSGILKDIYNGTKGANHLASYLLSEQSLYSSNHYRMYFTSNHDENSWSGTVFENFGDAAATFAVLTMTLDGMPLVYSGQEAGLDKRLAFFDVDVIPWQDHKFFGVYKTLLNLKKENEALWNGNDGSDLTRIITSASSYVFAFSRQKNDDTVMVFMNLSKNTQNASILSAGIDGKYRDIFSGDTLELHQTSSITLDKWQYKVLVPISDATEIENSAKPTKFCLEQNYPNPFNPTTKINYQLPVTSDVKLAIYDITGKKVATLVAEKQQAGNHTISWDAIGFANGIYFYRLNAGSFQQTKEMLLLK